MYQKTGKASLSKNRQVLLHVLLLKMRNIVSLAKLPGQEPELYYAKNTKQYPLQSVVCLIKKYCGG